MSNTSVYATFVNDSVESIIEQLNDSIGKYEDRIGQNNQEFYINLRYGKLIKAGLQTFGCNYAIRILFDEIKYEVYIPTFTENGSTKELKFIEELLHKPLTAEQINQIVEDVTDVVYKHIDFNTKKIGLRK